MNEDRLLDLLDAYLAGALTAPEAVELKAHLKESNDARRFFLNYLQQEMDIHDLLMEKSGVLRVLSADLAEEDASFPRPKSARLAIFYAVAACLVIGLGLGWFRLESSKRALMATIVEAHVGAQVVRATTLFELTEGQKLIPGDEVIVSPKGRLIMAYADGSRVELAEDTRIFFGSQPSANRQRSSDTRPSSKYIWLQQGTLEATVAKQPPGEPMVIRTPDAEAKVLGTQFQLHVKDNSTRLNVENGVVGFQRLADGRDARVSKGEQAMVTADPADQLSVARVDTLPFQEDFENPNLAAKGWYDVVTPVLSSAEHISGSSHSAEFRFRRGDEIPVVGFAVRRRFLETDAVYVGYWVKRSSNWTDSPFPSCEVRLMTNKDGDWEGAGYTHLTLSIGLAKEGPVIWIQDGKNIDETRVGQDLVELTEMRAVAGGNGDSDGYGVGIWYQNETFPANVHSNQKVWLADGGDFTNGPRKSSTEDWHHVEVYIKLNNASNGKSRADGQLEYWYDGTLVISHENVMLRTAANADMKFNQFLLAPYISHGSPAEQTLWLDDLTVATARPADLQARVQPGDVSSPFERAPSVEGSQNR